jgi:hypothetical protein
VLAALANNLVVVMQITKKIAACRFTEKANKNNRLKKKGFNSQTYKK